MMCDSEGEEELCTPPNLLAQANNARQKTLPASGNKYLKAYKKFMEWRNYQNTISFSENVLLAYFEHYSQSRQPSALWPCYSMLKSILSLKHNVHIDKYSDLTSFLKRQTHGYQPKKAVVFTTEQIRKFLHEASDDRYLAHKVNINESLSII